MEKVIEVKGFEKEYSFLSNFWESPISLSYISPLATEDCKANIINIVFPTVEHAFQGFKVFKDWKNPTDSEIKDFIAFSKYETPGKAKRAGRQVAINPEYWNSHRNEVMLFLLRKKFEIPELKEKLLATGNAYLEETNYWKDIYWGVCNGIGENNLGKLLMQLRQELKNKIKTV